MDDDFTSIPVDGVPWLTTVRCYDETMTHISEGHPEFRHELPSFQKGLIAAIRNPDVIYDSTTSPGRSVVFVSSAFTHRANPVHIPVRIISDTSCGRIQTAYFAAAGTYAGKPLWKPQDG